MLDLVPPDAPEVSFIGLGRTSEIEVAWREIADGDSPWVDLVAVPPEVEPPEEETPVPEEVDVAALVASVAAAVDELPPVEDRWAVEIARGSDVGGAWRRMRKPSSRRSRRSPSGGVPAPVRTVDLRCVVWAIRAGCSACTSG